MAQAAVPEAETRNRTDVIYYHWDDLPFRDEAEKAKAQEFAKYLSEARGMDSKSLKPFEMSTFFLGNSQNNEQAATQYINFLKFASDHKFGSVSEESLQKSMTLLKRAYALGGTVTDPKSGTIFNIFASAGKEIVPANFDSTSTLIKALYYIWNEFNFYRKFEISRQQMILVVDLSGLGMKNFKLSVQKAAVTLMQGIYPMNLNTIYMCEAPFMMKAVVGIVTKLIDTGNIKLIQTTKKEAFQKIGDIDQIPAKVGGKYVFDPKELEKQDKQEKAPKNSKDSKGTDEEAKSKE